MMGQHRSRLDLIRRRLALLGLFLVLVAGSARGSGPSATSDQYLMTAFDLDAAGMEKVKAAVQAGDLEAVQQAYLDYRRTASPAKWNIMPSDQPAKPFAKTEPLAEDVAAHKIHNLWYEAVEPKLADFGPDFNWFGNPFPSTDPHAASNWHGWLGIIARTQFWEQLAYGYWMTQNEKYPRGWVEQLESFAANVPILIAGLNDPKRTGNWITAECCGLYTIGVLYPELKESARSRQIAMDRFVVEINKLVPPDGFEAELSTGYDTSTMEQFTVPTQLAPLNHIALPDIFRSKLISMYRALVLVMDQSGNDVPTNDSWIINAACLAPRGLKLGDDPLLEWAGSCGRKGVAPPDSTMLPYAGFYAMRSGWKPDDLFLFFRGGPIGIGHQHEEDLELVLRAWNKTLLYDPGTFTYDRSEMRRYVLGTSSHSTILVDGKWQHAGSSSLPPPARLALKLGMDEQIITKWTQAGAELVAHAAVGQSGWYKVGLRYCSGGGCLVSFLINEKIPFEEAEDFPLDSTLGAAPSDGWSNVVSDWRDVVCGDDSNPMGLKIYLPAGDDKIGLRLEGGSGANLAWLSLVPVTR